MLLLRQWRMTLTKKNRSESSWCTQTAFDTGKCWFTILFVLVCSCLVLLLRQWRMILTGVNLAGVDKLPLTQVSAGLPYFLFWFAAI